MFGWRKRPQGFEWQEYVRTTILVRRAERENRARDAFAAARAWLAERAAHLWTALRREARSISARLRRGFGTAFAHFSSTMAGMAQRLRHHDLGGLVILAGSVALALAAARGVTSALDTIVAITAGTGFAALLLGLSAVRGGVEPGWLANARSKLGSAPRVLWWAGGFLAGGAICLAGLLITGGAETAAFGDAWRRFAATTSRLFDGGKAIEVKGRATAITGDRARAADRVIQLEGVEAPDRDQRCQKTRSSPWRCGEAAREALARILRGRTVTCRAWPLALPANGKSDTTERPVHLVGNCRIGDRDVATELVRAGHVFASPGASSVLRIAETEAKAARRGVWVGDNERPGQWRQRLWTEASRRAPDGCPIKGAIANGRKKYLLPWHDRYERTQIRAARGERWFCSEDEARTAGWRGAAPS